MIIKCGHCKRCGFCCEHFLESRGEYPFDAEYYLAHGVSIIKAECPESKHVDGLYILAIPSHCKHFILRDDMKLGCELHGTDKQTSTCKLYPYNVPNDFYYGLSTLNKCGYFFIEFEPETIYPSAC